MKEKELALIILNYRNWEMTAELVKKLIEKKFKGILTIVDNNSPNNSYVHLKKMFSEKENIYMVENNTNSGYGSGNNFGIKYTLDNNPKIKYIGIVNPDVMIDECFEFEKILDYLELEGVSSISPRQNLNGDRSIKHIGWKLPDFKKILISNLTFLRFKMSELLYNEENIEYFDESEETYVVDVLPGSFFIIKRDIFDEIGFFDKNTFMYSEENIIAYELKKLNKKQLVTKNIYYLHNHQEKDKSLLNYTESKKDYQYKIDSQKIYAWNYLEINKIQKIIYYIAVKFHVYLELPIVIWIKKRK
ncbi:MAG: glycosyltransferase [Culicoidibacterales bacterium]